MSGEKKKDKEKEKKRRPCVISGMISLVRHNLFSLGRGLGVGGCDFVAVIFMWFMRVQIVFRI